MDNKSLVRISLICAIAGLALIYALSCVVEPQSISVNLLDRYEGRVVSVIGSVVDLRRHEAGHIFIKLQDESGTCEVPLFQSLAQKVPVLYLGDRLRVVGVVEEYRDSLQVVPRTERDLTLLDSAPIPIAVAGSMVGKTVRIQGIAYGIRESDSGQTFQLTDGKSCLRVVLVGSTMVESGLNVTLCGTIKLDGTEAYLAGRQLVDLTDGGVETIPIADLGSRQGIFKVGGRLQPGAAGLEIDDGSGRILPDGSLIIGMIEGDIVEAMVAVGETYMNVLEVELTKTDIMPLQRLSTEMVGRTVRIRGVVVNKFISGKNAFLTLYNGTQVEVPIFGVGKDINIELGDVLTLLGRVGVYREKLQVVPKDMSGIFIEAGKPVDRPLDELSQEDLYTLIRTRGRVSSIKRYSTSCSMWIRGETAKMRVYLTFDPGSNASVGAEIEIVGLVRTYNDELEIVPRGPEDLG